MFKRNLLILLIPLLFGFIILGYFQKDRINAFISGAMQQEVNSETKLSVEDKIEEEYNYSKNGKSYDFTLLEFGSTGCTMCKQMKPILEEIKGWKNRKVNVVFMHIMKAENLSWMKYYGISAVPMQILLDNQGKEFFRHYGVISASDIENVMIEHFSNEKSPVF